MVVGMLDLRTDLGGVEYMVSKWKKSVIGRWVYQHGKYTPHQGEQEKARRRRQMGFPEIIASGAVCVPMEVPTEKLPWWIRLWRYILGRP
jgi:hypothetical protein